MERILIGERCEVLVDRGLVFEDVLPPRANRDKVAVFTQPGATHIADLVVAALPAREVRLMVLPDREAAKTLAIAGAAYEWLATIGINRHDTVVGVGGGSVTDLAGFVAATYLRGIEAVHVPTTLLGAVDAAIGGKTGVNLGGKNLVGAFHHPTRVVIDLDLLDLLPVELKREGMAEALKAGLIADPALFAHLAEAGLEAGLDFVVPRAVGVKADVVGEDFRESGLREILNYGHTIGHAVEIAAGVSHGHAIAIGMVAAGFIAKETLGFDGFARQDDAIARLGLPVRAIGLAREDVLSILAQDKKRDSGGTRMVLLRAIGDPVVLPVDRRSVDQGLAAIGVV